MSKKDAANKHISKDWEGDVREAYEKLFKKEKHGDRDIDASNVEQNSKIYVQKAMRSRTIYLQATMEQRIYST